MASKLTVYFLTYNSENKYLHQILEKIKPIADEILFVDSGSTDNTRAIAERYGARFLIRPFDDFSSQRGFVAEKASYDFLFGVDDDEIPTDELIQEIKELKETDFPHDAYVIRRNNYVLGKQVKCYYPVNNPDYIIRIINRKYVKPGERKVHPTPYGYRSLGHLKKGEFTHYTFETDAELNSKIKSYGKVAAKEVIARNEKYIWLRSVAMPYLVWGKWYLIKGGWRDGKVGWKLGRYAFLTVKTKYKNALKMTSPS